MNYKTGKILYHVYVDSDDGKFFLSEYIVRTVRGGYAYAVKKENGTTWVKKSKKSGDFGWSDSIPSYYREKTKVGEPFCGLQTTKLAAYRAALKSGLKYTDISLRLRAKKVLEKKISYLRKK